eukprot:COSAG05_NODE_9952_length_591_cov_1.560976_1_plen_133_part_10
MVDFASNLEGGYGFGEFFDNIDQNQMFEYCSAPQHESRGLVAMRCASTGLVRTAYSRHGHPPKQHTRSFCFFVLEKNVCVAPTEMQNFRILERASLRCAATNYDIPRLSAATHVLAGGGGRARCMHDAFLDLR